MVQSRSPGRPSLDGPSAGFAPADDAAPKCADVVVIGGGIVGVATAFWTSRAGLDTVLVEMRDGLSTLTTPSSVECFRAQFTEPTMVELAKPSIEVFDHFADVVGIPGYDIAVRHGGYLFMTDDAGMLPDVQASVRRHHELGVEDSEYLSGDEVWRRFPFVAPGVVGATFRQNDGWLSSHEATQGFAKGSRARFLLRTRATGIRVDSEGVAAVETTRGTICTRTVVNAAGPFAGVVAKMVGIDLPVRPVRRQKAFIAPRECIPQYAPFTVDLVTGAYWRPEVGGALLGWVDPDEPRSEPSEKVPVDWDFAAIVVDKLTRLNPFWGELAGSLTRNDVRVSAGQYVYTPDDQPLIGQIAEVQGFYLNCGYWAGVMLSPAAGLRIADLITGRLRPEDNPLRPTRYAEGIFIQGSSFLRGH